MSEAGKNTPSKTPQYLSATIAGLSGFANGIALCPLILGISDNSYIPFSIDGNPYLPYLNIFGALLGTAFSGFVCEQMGPKRAIQISAFPLFMSRLITAYCRTVYGFYVSTILQGFAAGISLFSAINYSTDISDKRERKSVALMYFALHCLGIICAQIIGSNVDDFILQALIPSVVPVIYLTALSFIPESPVHMCMNDDLPQACSSLQWLRGPDYDIDDEIARIQLYTKTVKTTHAGAITNPNQETSIRFISRNTLARIFAADALFAVLYILHSRSLERLEILTRIEIIEYEDLKTFGSTETMSLPTKTNEFMLPLIFLLMYIVKHVELKKLIQHIFIVTGFIALFIDVALYLMEHTTWVMILLFGNVVLTHLNIVLVTVLLWDIFDYVELKTKAIPVNLTMQIFWIINLQTLPMFIRQIPSFYLTLCNVILGLIVMKYSMAQALKSLVENKPKMFVQTVA